MDFAADAERIHQLSGDGDTKGRADVEDDGLPAFSKGEIVNRQKSKRTIGIAPSDTSTAKLSDEASFRDGVTDDLDFEDVEDVEEVNTKEDTITVMTEDTLTVVIEDEAVVGTTIMSSSHCIQQNQQSASPPNLAGMQLLQWHPSAVYPVNQCQGVVPVLAPCRPQMVAQEVIPPPLPCLLLAYNT